MIEVQEINFFDHYACMICPVCAQETSAYTVHCEACGGALGGEEFGLNFCEGQRPHTMHKTSMDEAENLIRLRQARHRLASGQIGVEAFLGEVGEVLAIVESALDLYESDFMKHQLDTMEPAAAEIYHTIASAAAEMEVGLQQMQSYCPGQTMGPVDAGLKRVEKALWKIDAAQDIAIERGSQC